MTRAQRAAQKALLSVLKGWQDPHGAGPIMDARWMSNIDVDATGAVRLALTPSRPHCPCCLADLADLRKTLAGKRGIASIHIEVENVPDAHRWTAAVN